MGADPNNAVIKRGRKLGARWFKNQSPTVLERIHDAVGLNFTPAIGGVGGSSDFDSQPIYKDIRLCNMQNGAVTAYQGDAGFTRTPGAGIDVMVEIPLFYYRIDESSDVRDFIISDQPFDGALISPRHAPHDGFPAGHPFIYVSAYTVNSAYQSMSGNLSQVSMTRDTARQACSARGANYWQYDFATYMTLLMLYIVEVADWNSQAAVGQGNTTTSAQIATGDSDNITFHSGSNDAAGAAVRAVKYRNIENMWGNIRQFVDGINFVATQGYVSIEPVGYDDATITGNYKQVGYTIAGTNGFITALGYDPAMPFVQMPSAVGGADGTFIPDQSYQSTGQRVLFVGGTWSSAASAGVLCFNASSSPAGAGTYIGARLLVLP